MKYSNYFADIHIKIQYNIKIVYNSFLKIKYQCYSTFKQNHLSLTKLKIMKSIYVSILLLFFTSCAKNDNCLDDAIGIFTGSCTSTFGTYQGDMTISKSSTGESNLLFKDEMLDSGKSTYNGTISSDCKTITIPSQSIIIGNGQAATINGTYKLNGSNLTGNLNVTFGTSGGVCTYNLTKR